MSSNEYREFRIVSTKSGLIYHLMKMNDSKGDLPSLGSPVKFFRQPYNYHYYSYHETKAAQNQASSSLLSEQKDTITTLTTSHDQKQQQLQPGLQDSSSKTKNSENDSNDTIMTTTATTASQDKSANTNVTSSINSNSPTATTTASANTANGNNASSTFASNDGFDINKVAPGSGLTKVRVASGANVFKKKTRTFYLGKQEDNDDESTGGLLKQRAPDPDRRPLILSSLDKKEVFEGRVEGGAQPNHVLFMFYNDGFQVIPCSKWYKFNKRATYQTLTLEEAEESLSKRNKGLASQNLWMMHKKNKDSKNGEAVEAHPARKFKVTDAPDYNDTTGKKVRRFKKSELDEELDYEEEFQDDDGLMELGIEDEEESKEARRRTYGKAGRKANFEDFDDEDFEEQRKINTGTEKELKKSLKRLEKGNVYESDEENPYVSEEEEDDEENVNSQAADTKDRSSAEGSPAHVKSKKKAKDDDSIRMSSGQNSPSYQTIKSSSPAAVLEALKNDSRLRREGSVPKGSAEGATSPAFMRDHSMSPTYPPLRSNVISPRHETPGSAEGPRIKLKMGDSMSDLKRKRDEDSSRKGDKKLKPGSPEYNVGGSRQTTPAGRAMSPPKSAPTPYTRGRTPGSVRSDDPNRLREEEITSILKSSGPMSVKDLVSKIRDRLNYQENKDLLRRLLSRLVTNDGGVLTLKPEYQ